MKILLIQSFLGRKEKPIYPLGLAYLAAHLKHHTIKAIDPNVRGRPMEEIAETIKSFHPEVIGISLRNLDTTQIMDPFVYLQGFKQTLAVVEKEAAKAKVVVGGSGFSIYAKEIMQQFFRIDAGVFLEAEDSFVELIDHWEGRDKVKGLYLRREQEVIFTGPREFRSIENLPFPDWDTVPVEPYKHLLDAVGVQTKRGCGLKCAYCNYPFLNGACYRFRSPEAVGEEIEKLVKDYRVERFIFVDSIFNIPREHCEKVMREIIRRKLQVKWTGWYNERNLDKELSELAIEAGCEFFSFSPDGFSDASLKALGKNLRKKDILRVYGLMRNYPQALVGYNFFINPPGQTVIDLLKLIAFGLKVKWTFRGRCLGFLLGSIRIEPDTPIFELAVKEGFIRRETALAAQTREELLQLFYRPPHSFVLTVMLKVIGGLKKLKRMIRPVKE